MGTAKPDDHIPYLDLGQNDSLSSESPLWKDPGVPRTEVCIVSSWLGA